MTTRQDLSIYQGDDYSATVTVSNADGTPADLSGYSAAAQIRRKPADLSAEVEAQFLVSILSPVIHLSLTHDETLALSGVYVWDLQLTDGASGAVITILYGQVRIAQEVTRAAVGAAART
jgi:hypothetical protein